MSAVQTIGLNVWATAGTIDSGGDGSATVPPATASGSVAATGSVAAAGESAAGEPNPVTSGESTTPTADANDDDADMAGKKNLSTD
jgi:hypothetical protein